MLGSEIMISVSRVFLHIYTLHVNRSISLGMGASECSLQSGRRRISRRPSRRFMYPVLCNQLHNRGPGSNAISRPTPWPVDVNDATNKTLRRLRISCRHIGCVERERGSVSTRLRTTVLPEQLFYGSDARLGVQHNIYE